MDEHIKYGEAEGQTIVNEEVINNAITTLEKYRRGKANLDKRIVDEEQFWKLRHWDVLKRDKKVSPNATDPEPASAWLFNSILNKHADAMDNMPEPIVLPRERSDEEAAKVLEQVLPVVMEYNDFSDVYSTAWWDKLKHGTCAYGVFWNPEKENGLGDIDIHEVDLLKMFWEPGIENIQDSRNLFIVDLVDNDVIDAMYPDKADQIRASNMAIAEYVYDDSVDTSDKSAVVDWYYKVKRGTKTVLHYCKFVGKTVLYASENDPEYAERGWYDHAKYPVVFDTMYPVKGTPVGFGVVAVGRDPQLYIDKMSGYVLESAMMAQKVRYLVSESCNINIDDLLDWNNPIVKVQGQIDDARMKEIVTKGVDPNSVNILQMKVEEMKDTTANRDVNSGGTVGGVDAASAIAALQEAGNKNSRDMLTTSYRAYEKVLDMCIELIRQFYDESRCFRITQPNGEYEFLDMNNQNLRDQQVQTPVGIMMRRPVFDVRSTAQKKNPFSRMEQNERAKEMYGMGFFNPDRASEALACLEMMDFEGIQKVKDKISENQTLAQICQQLMMENMMLKGQMPPMPNQPSQSSNGADGMNMPDADESSSNRFANGLMQANTPMTSYGQRLAKRSTPSME